MATRFQWSRISDFCWSCAVGHGAGRLHLEVVQLDSKDNWRGRVSVGDAYEHQWFVLRECWRATDVQTKQRTEEDLLDVLKEWSRLHEELTNNG